MKTSFPGSLVAVAALTFAFNARAQDCVVGPVAVPGLSGPPIWTHPSGTGYRLDLHDPRWSGAPARPFVTSTATSGTTDNGLYRVLYAGGYLYVAFEALADSTAAGSGDTAYFAFDDGSAGTSAYAVRVQVDTTASAIASPSGAPSWAPHDTAAINASSRVKAYVTTNDATTTGWTVVPQTVTATDLDGISWLEDVTTWRTSPGAVWGVTFKVNLNASALNISAPTKMFFGLRAHHMGSTVVELGSPSAVAMASGIGTDTIIPPASTSWGDMTAPGVACTGVTLDRADVGTVPSVGSSATPSNEIDATGTSGSPTTNVFRVIARNLGDSFSGVPQAVRARIRIADWGSTIANREHAPWRDIPGILPLGPNVLVVDGSAAAGNFSTGWSNSWVNEAGPNGRWEINYTCQIQGTDGYCPKLVNPDMSTPVNYKHQCMLVEIGAKDPGIKFANQAVYRNMTFNGLSTLSDPATITLQGLKATLGGVAADRDVYIYVQAMNMPPHGSQPLWLNHEGMAAARRYVEFPPARPEPDRVELDKLLKRAPRAASAALPAAAATVPPRAQSTPRIGLLDYPVLTPHQALTTAYPTYMVRVYYDTGKVSKVDGEELKVIEPMIPFGYYLDHAGALYGFKHLIEGIDGAVLTEVGPNFYRVHMASEAKIHVKNTISAEEQPARPPHGCPPPNHCPPPVPPKGHCGCRVVGTERGDLAPVGAALALALAVLRRRRSRRNSPSRS